MPRLPAVLIALSLASPAVAKDVVVHAGALLDGVSATPRREVSILITDDKITGVQAGYVIPAGAEVIDLTHQTVMPGFIDCHIHISERSPGGENEVEYGVTHNDIDQALNGAKYGREMLLQGFTSARDVGGGDETVSLRNAFAEGTLPGPRLFVSFGADGADRRPCRSRQRLRARLHA
jgi:imidazolonepropionase-like amidohydrolase